MPTNYIPFADQIYGTFYESADQNQGKSRTEKTPLQWKQGSVCNGCRSSGFSDEAVHQFKSYSKLAKLEIHKRVGPAWEFDLIFKVSEIVNINKNKINQKMYKLNKNSNRNSKWKSRV